jgi:erythromycin esterase-like protein
VTAPSRQSPAEALRRFAYPLTGSAGDYDPLLERVGDARVVLLGEASHGTHEFYRQRALITMRLITEKGFDAVAAEADWPDAYRVNAWVRGRSAARSADEALGGFKRFPTWMWRNADVLEFVEWLRRHNESVRDPGRQAGFYGLDLYSLYASIEAVVAYLDRVDPEAAARARYRYSCFQHFGEDTQAYGYAAGFGLSPSCEEGALQQLAELQANALEYARRDGRVAEDDLFHAEQNARVVRDAERYYRTMFASSVDSWNLRDRHMAETLHHLLEHLAREGRRSKVVVWEHNSHVGDARATEMGRRGELNVGQLARESYGPEAVNAGFTTYAGTVTAAHAWDGPALQRHVRPALPGSYEALFHEAGLPRFLLDLSRPGMPLAEPRLERAIGVIYRPETERISHYFLAHLVRQFDMVIHFDETRAVEPLEPGEQWHGGEPPETFPFGQ